MRKPLNEKERLARLRALNVLDKGLDSTCESIVALAAEICSCPAAFISFMESEKQIFRAQVGTSLSEIPRQATICAETILSDEPLIIPSIRQEARFTKSLLSLAPHNFDFYAGVPLLTKDHLIIGTLCVLDTAPREITAPQIHTLQTLAQHIVSHIELHNKLAAVQRTISSLEDSEQRFRKIADASPVLLWISDESGNRTLSNKAWCDFTGLSQEESLAECWRDTLHPDDREVYKAKWDECAKANTRFQHEFRVRHASGTYRWVMEQAIPLFASNGHLEAYVSSCVDLSLRSSDELQDQHNEARFRAISEAAPLGILVTDSNGNCIYSNHQFQNIAGLTNEQSLGSGWIRAIHPDDRARIQAAWAEATQKTQSFENSFRYQHPDGTIAWCSLKAAAINSTDTVSGWVSTIEDVTEKRKAEEDLLAAKQAAELAMHSKSQFLANMSHEIRTPLTAIIGFAEALRDEHNYEATQLHCIDVIVNNGKHLLKIINDILDLSKIDAGALTVEKSPCDIIQMVEDLRLMFAPTIAEKSIAFSVNYEWPLPRMITTDPLRLKQVLINLLSNAIKFTDRGSITLNVGWDNRETQATFTVADTGIGMSSNQIDSLFKPFCQANESITRKYGGTGLGLSISDRLVRALGGTMHVRSRVGYGTTISFSVQSLGATHSALLKKLPSDHLTAHAESPQQRPSLQGKVLFADDALDNRRLVEHLLRKAGLDVVLAEDGQEALDAALANPFDLILMDVQMPHIDGLSATQKIREAGVSTPIVALSAGAMTSDVKKALEAGCSMHLSKPFTNDSFYSVLAKYLTVAADSPHEIPEEPLHSTLAGGDPDMIPLLTDFIEGLPARVADITSAANNQDNDKLSSLAHKLKGSAGMYGFPELSLTAGRLEGAAKQGNREQTDLLLAEIHSLVPRIQRGKSAIRPPGRNDSHREKTGDPPTL